MHGLVLDLWRLHDGLAQLRSGTFAMNRQCDRGMIAHRRDIPRPRSVVKFAAVIVSALLVTSASSLAIRWPLAMYRVSSASMLPTLQCAGAPGCLRLEDDTVLIDRLAYVFGSPSRGDIIAFQLRRPTCGGNPLIKRVVALPGDVIRLVNRQVYVDGHLVTRAPQWTSRRHHQLTERLLKVPPNSVFVLGDNPTSTCDSRAFGAVQLGDIVGRAFAIAWPKHDLRIFFSVGR